MADLKSSSKATDNKQITLMRKTRASTSFDTTELSSLLWGRYVACAGDAGFWLTYSSTDEVQARRAAFERVEAQLGTNNTTKLPPCYVDTSRNGLYEQGLRMGKDCIEEMEKHNHDLFVWVTPRYNLINAR
jgi:acyl-CoA oxidase